MSFEVEHDSSKGLGLHFWRVKIRFFMQNNSTEKQVTALVA